MNPATQRQRWLCILLPQLALDLCWRSGLAPERALAVIDGADARRTIHQCSAAATAAGIRPGMTVASAQTLLPELQLSRRAPAAEMQAITHLAAWAYGYSSRVGIQPGLLLLEIAGSRRLVGPEVLKQMQAELTELGFQACFGHGPGPAAARLAARCAAQRVNTRELLKSCAFERIAAGAPLHLSEFTPDTLRMLAECGIHTLGALAELPRDALIRRIGQAGLQILDQLLGHTAELVPEYQPPLGFFARIELPAALQQTGALLFPLKRLLTELVAVLNGSERCVQQLLLELELDRSALGNPQPPLRVPLGLSSPSRDPVHLLELARYTLERLQLPAAVVGLGLRAEQLLEYRPASADLFETRGPERLNWPQLVERLRARLGVEAMCQLELQAEHRPERSWRICNSPNPVPATASVLPRQARWRPLWLLSEVQPINRQRLQLLSGPERIETGWWDGRDASRDYYIARDAEQRRLWVYQERRSPQRWFVQGVYS